MNSIILSAFVTFCKNIASAFKVSGLGRLLMAIYTAISNSWNNSKILSFIKSLGMNKTFGVTVKVLRFPFAVLECVNAKISKKLHDKIENSFICTTTKLFIQNFMAVNTRFWGIMIVSCAVVYSLCRMQLSASVAVSATLGAMMCLFNYNLMGFLNPSKFVCFVKNALGFGNVSFDFFDENSTVGRIRLIPAIVCGVIMGVCACISPLGLMLSFALFGMTLVVYVPVTGVYAAVFLAPFLPTMLLAGICLWTALSLVIKSVVDDKFKWRLDGVGICIILLLGVLLVSSLASFARMSSLKVWAMYFVFLLFFVVMTNTIETKAQLYGLLKVFVISGALVALYGVMQYLFGWTTSNAWIDEEMFEDATMRVYSTLGNPNVLGEYLLLVLPVAATYMLKYKFKELSKWAYGAMFLVLALCLVLTQSRGCWIGFMLSVVIFVTFYEGKLWGLIPIVLCILPFIVPQTIVDRIMSVGNMDDTSTSYRVYIWMGTLGMMKHYWLGGIGMGESAFAQVYPFFSYNAISAPHSHNLFLQLLVEAGVSGLGVFIIMQIVFAKKMSDTYRFGDKKSIDSMLSLALGSGVIGFLAQSMFDYTFYNYRVMAVFFMVMAMGMTLHYLKGVENSNYEA